MVKQNKNFLAQRNLYNKNLEVFIQMYTVFQYGFYIALFTRKN